MQAQQGGSAEGVDPVAHGGRQTQLLARDEVFRQPTVAPSVHFHVAVHGQRSPVVVVLAGPAASQFRLPVAHGVLGAGEQAQLAAQRLGLGAAVEAEDGAPLAGRLVAEGLGITDSGQRHAGDEQEDGGQAVESGGQAEQAVGGAEQALAQQHRQRREDAAASDGVSWLGEPRRGLVGARSLVGGNAAIWSAENPAL